MEETTAILPSPVDNNVTGPRFVVRGRLSSSHHFHMQASRMACWYCIHHFMQMQHFTPNLGVSKRTIVNTFPDWRYRGALLSFLSLGFGGHVHALHT